MLTITIVTESFNYGKNNREFWDKAKFYDQLVNEALLITNNLYFHYSLICFDNMTSYFVYVENILQTPNINNKVGKKYFWMKNR